jgi:ribosome-binding protein aMBF1 (putative translation factor)
MIENERQYLVTQKRIAQFEESLASLRATPRPEKMPSHLHRAMQESVESQLADLRQEVAEYEALKARPAPMLELHSLSELPDLLIKARIARGYTQAELARRLKLKSQQIQRYEATRYRSVNFECLLKIAQALDVDLQESRVAVSAGKNVNHAENTSREGL